MFGFLVRTVGCLILAVATAFAIGDIARSLSADTLRLTSVAEAFAYFNEGAATTGAGLPPVLWNVVSAWPVSPTLAVLAFLVLLIGRRRRPHVGHANF